jgi:hypothetical protein
LKAIEETAPEMIRSLKTKPFKALDKFASRYREISPHVFGAPLWECNGQSVMRIPPLADLAMLICFPDRQRPENPWPPAAPFWEPELRAYLLDLSIAMKEWAENFRDSRGAPHSRLIGAALETMRVWLNEPEINTDNHWYGISEVISQGQLERSEMNIKIQSWNALEETEQEFIKRVRTTTDQIQRWARNQIPEIKKVLISYDTKRNREHFDWAVLRLWRELTYPQIAEVWANMKREGSPKFFDEATVRKGAQTALRAIGLRDLKFNRK